MRRVGSLLLAVVALVSLAPAASAHIVTEAPWHPLAYAYRTAIFLINLRPTDWALVERTFTLPAGPGAPGGAARQYLVALDEATDAGHWPAIEQAIAAKDRDALYAAATLAVSQAIRHHLAEAASHLDEPGAATRTLEEARALYRSFADFIQETDPTGFRDVGLAWLDLASSVGHAGVVATGTRPADEVAFAAARGVIESYLIANYEPEAWTARTSYAPVPATLLAANPELEVGAWLPPGSDLNDQEPLPRLVLNFEEQGIDERDLFLVAFGDMLFDSPEIFGEPARSLGMACSTCHNRSDVNQRFFIPGISPQPGAVDVDGNFFNARFNDYRDDALDIPSLRGIRFTAPYGRDGRFAGLRDFTRNVIVNEFNGDEPSPLVLDALVTYMLEFDFLPAPYLDFDGTLNDLAPAGRQARRGSVPKTVRADGQPLLRQLPRARFPLHRQPRAQHRLGRGGLWQRQRRLRHADPAERQLHRTLFPRRLAGDLGRRGRLVRPALRARPQRRAARRSHRLSRDRRHRRGALPGVRRREHAVPAHGGRAFRVPQHPRHADPGTRPGRRRPGAAHGRRRSRGRRQRDDQPCRRRQGARAGRSALAAARCDRGRHGGRRPRACGRTTRRSSKNIKRSCVDGRDHAEPPRLRRLLRRPGARRGHARGRRRADPHARLHSAGEPGEAAGRRRGDHRLAGRRDRRAGQGLRHPRPCRGGRGAALGRRRHLVQRRPAVCAGARPGRRRGAAQRGLPRPPQLRGADLRAQGQRHRRPGRLSRAGRSRSPTRSRNRAISTRSRSSPMPG